HVLPSHLFDLFVHNFFFFASRRRHTRFSRDWSSDVCSSDLLRMRDEAAVAGRSVTTVLPAQLLDGTQLGCGLGQTSGGGSVVEIHALLVQSLLSSLDGGLSGSFVDVFGASSSIG